MQDISSTDTARRNGSGNTGFGELEERTSIRWISFIARLVLGVIFLVSGAEKLGTLDAFSHAIANYKMLPLSLINVAATLIVWTEIVVAIFLIAGAAVRGAALVTGSMLVLFIVAILTAMARGLDIDCGCFAPGEGGEPDKVGWPKVFEDLAMLAGAIFLIYFPKSPFTVDRLLRSQGRAGEEG